MISDTKKPKIVFFGTPEFAVIPLEALVEAGYEITGVITAVDKPKGRKLVLTPPPVKMTAQKHNLPVYQPSNKTELLETVKKLRPELGIVAAFGMILPKELLEMPEYGVINIHPSLLPRWRGPSPIQYAILSGDKKTGVAIMAIDEKMDEGPILAVRELDFIIHNLKFIKLHDELAELGAKLLIETIPKWLAGEIKPALQDRNKATYSKIIKKEEGLINWDEPPEAIERQIRAFTPWPGAYTFVNGKRVIITEAGLDKNNALVIERVKPEGKNEVSFEDYLRGNQNFILKRTP